MWCGQKLSVLEVHRAACHGLRPGADDRPMSRAGNRLRRSPHRRLGGRCVATIRHGLRRPGASTRRAGRMPEVPRGLREDGSRDIPTDPPSERFCRERVRDRRRVRTLRCRGMRGSRARFRNARAPADRTAIVHRPPPRKRQRTLRSPTSIAYSSANALTPVVTMTTYCLPLGAM